MRKTLIFAYNMISSNKSILICTVSLFILTFLFPHYILSEDLFRKVTVVYPYNIATDWDMAFNQEFYNTIIKNRGANTRISFLNIKYSLDNSSESKNNLIQQFDMIKEEYKPDLIVAMFASVQNLFLELENNSLNNITKIFVPVVPQMYDSLNKISNSFIVRSSSEYAIQSNIQSFIEFLPNRKHLVVVSGTGENDSPYLEMFQKKIKELSLHEYFSIDYIVGQPEAELVESIRKYRTKNSILYFLPYNMDEDDNVYEISYLFPIIYNNSDMPVFSFFNDTLPLGAIGGIMTSPESYGKFSAEIALKIINSEIVDHSVEQAAYVHQYNWLELKKWGINEKILPEGSEILFRQYSFLEEYKTQIILVAILVIFETFLVIALSFNLVNRRRAETELRKNAGFFERTEKIAKLAGWEIDNISKKLILTTEAQHILALPGDKQIFIKSIMKNIEKSDLKKFKEVVRAVNRKSSIDDVIRYKTNTGNYSWLRIAGGPVKISNRLTRMSGIIQDISVQKDNELRLEKTLTEKEILLKEVHHRVKNNLAIILSIIELQKDAFDQPEINDILKRTQGRVRTIAQIFELLFLENDIETVEFENFVVMLVNSIVSENWDKGPGLKTDIEVEDFSLNLDLLFPIGLIINEIVDNSLRHGLAAVEDPELRVKASKIRADESYIKIIISDNGSGFKINGNSADKKQTVGLFLVETLVDQLGGSLDINTGDGTVFEIGVVLN